MKMNSTQRLSLAWPCPFGFSLPSHGYMYYIPVLENLFMEDVMVISKTHRLSLSLVSQWLSHESKH